MNFKVDSEEFLKDKIDTKEFDDFIYNQMSKAMSKLAREADIDIAKTPLVDLLTAYTRYKELDLFNKTLTLRIDKAMQEIEYLISNCDITDYQGEKIINILKGEYDEISNKQE